MNINKQLKDIKLQNKLKLLLLLSFTNLYLSYANPAESLYTHRLNLDKESITNQQNRKITGKIVDSNGEAIIGANIIVKESNNGTVTDINGEFAIENINDNDIIQISYIGYIKQEIKLQSKSHYEIKLISDNQNLEEVVVVGYGTQRKKELTGSVTSLKSDEIIKIATNSFTNSLQGKIPGVQISQSSGAPGAGSSVRIRGVGTTGANEPLYVIDGLPIEGSNMSISGSSDNISGLSIVNPNDIESIEVLKDAAAAAIYGARAANGVILITTKRGSEGLAKINYNSYIALEELWKKPDFLNAREFATLANELFANSNMEANPEFSNPESLGTGTDWIDAIFQTGFTQNHDLSVSGGTKNTKAYSTPSFSTT
ncbi:SusC/RagA family TonB-linked outer membrane protein [Macellibacteroides fermentans]|uniref:SusC/RagA family TonB-linked outer membrane protein n=1 Tax=Macellibacteroides fermentans TaxID=879969 RepID=UPI00406C588E